MKATLWLLIYLATAILIVTIHRLSPTNLAGPGLDIVVYFLATVGATGVLAKNLVPTTEMRKQTGPRLLNILGSLTVLTLAIYSFFNG